MPQHNIPDPAVLDLHKALGIPETYSATCKLDFHPDCHTLVDTEADIYGRQPRLDARANIAWQTMKARALEQGVSLQIVSAFRSAEYQKTLLAKKLAQGELLEDILRVNAAPGYSEHHSGCALDITTPGYAPLEEAFENSPAFAWLTRHAGEFGFSLSFPRGNNAGMIYEPWHWKYSAD